MAAMSALRQAMLALTRILHSDSLSKIMDLPKPRSQVQALQAKLDSLVKKASKILSSKPKPKNLNQDLEEDVFGSDDFFSEDQTASVFQDLSKTSLQQSQACDIILDMMREHWSRSTERGF